MDAGLSLREIFAELSRTGGDPADVLHAAGYGDVPEPLVAEAIASYAGTAPLEVAEHLAPFAVAHGPVPDPGAGPASAHAGLSLLASAPAVDAPTPPDDPEVHDGHAGPHVDDLAGHLDVDPSALDGADGPDGHTGHAPGPDHTLDHAGVDPAAVDGLDHGSHPAPGSFGEGHDPATGPADPVGAGGPDHHVDAFLAQEHVHDVDVHGHDVSDHDPGATGAEPAEPLLEHDDATDPTDVLDGDDHHLA